jgi:hypothetical protein
LEEKMFGHTRLGAIFLAVPLALLVLMTPLRAELDISILQDLNYDELEWLEDTANPGNWYAVLSGDPTEPSPYVLLNKVMANHFTQPHIHPRAREVYVVQGTWWVGTGTDLNPDKSVAKPEGSRVENRANEVHWDGAKDEDVLLLVGGEGPATTEFVH